MGGDKNKDTQPEQSPDIEEFKGHVSPLNRLVPGKWVPIQKPTSGKFGPRGATMVSQDWELLSSLDNKEPTRVIEIRGDIYSHDIITEALDNTLNLFGSASTIIYLRINNTGTQQEIIEKLGLDWEVEDMPWLLVLDKDPRYVAEGDNAIQFRLGNLQSGKEVKSISAAIIKASRDEDFMKKLTWEKRKRKLQSMMPALRESTDLVIKIVGL